MSDGFTYTCNTLDVTSNALERRVDTLTAQAGDECATVEFSTGLFYFGGVSMKSDGKVLLNRTQAHALAALLAAV